MATKFTPIAQEIRDRTALWLDEQAHQDEVLRVARREMRVEVAVVQEAIRALPHLWLVEIVHLVKELADKCDASATRVAEEAAEELHQVVPWLCEEIEREWNAENE